MVVFQHLLANTQRVNNRFGNLVTMQSYHKQKDWNKIKMYEAVCLTIVWFYLFYPQQVWWDLVSQESAGIREYEWSEGVVF